MSKSRESLMLSQDQLDDVIAQFNTIDADGNGFISLQELDSALKTAGFKLPGYKIRVIMDDYDKKNKDGRLDFEEFKMLCARVKGDEDRGHIFKKVVSKKENVQAIGGMSSASSEGTTHSVRNEEQVAFSDWINKNLKDDPDCQKYLPLHPEGRDLYEKAKDGILLCKLVNHSANETIDERTINKPSKTQQLSVYKRHENLTLALNSSSAIGCNIVNIGAEDLEQGKPHLLLGLLWQIIRIGLLSEINLQNHPGLVALLEEGETIDDLMKLSPEDILKRWVNYHLRNSGCGRQIANFQSDIKDSVAYIHLLHQIAPRENGVGTTAEHESDILRRAELMLEEAEKIECRSFVSANDVVKGNYKLNLAFVANLFNEYPALQKPEQEVEVIEETREEKTYRNWMNSMGVSPFVHYLYTDLRDGLVIFQLYDTIKPGCVQWNRVTRNFQKLKLEFQKRENCNYAVELGNECKFSLVGIGGVDLYDGNQTLTLALVWQLMRAYTLRILTELAGTGVPIKDKDIIHWANEKLASAGKTSVIDSFQDRRISDGRVVIDLIDAIKPRSINYDLLKDGSTEGAKLKNAKYAISMSRKIGARVYALPEDIVEVKQRMVMTVFACLMQTDLKSRKEEED